MAIDDVSFVNLRGETISRENLVNQMVGFYELKRLANETRVTDFSEGSEIRNILESTSVDVYYLMQMENDILSNTFIDTATGMWLDKIGLHPFIRLPRYQGEYARGNVTFSIPDSLNTDFIIPKGTILIGNGLIFLTDSEYTILAGETTVTANVTCSIVGIEGNVEQGSITVIDDINLVNSGLSVVNENTFTGGVDFEEDELYRSRLLSFVRKDDFGSLPYYVELCGSLPGVHDVVLVDDETYTKKVLVNGDVKPTLDSVLLVVLTKLSELGAKVIDHTFTVGKPVFDEVDLDVDILVNNSMDTDIVKHILEDLIDGGSRVEGFEYIGLNISQGINQQELYGVFSVIDNIVSVTITSDDELVTNIECLPNHVLKAGTITVTQSIIGE